MNDAVESLISKAEKATSADDALKYSQSALNVANAISREGSSVFMDRLKEIEGKLGEKKPPG